MTTENHSKKFDRKQAFTVFFGALGLLTVAFLIYWWLYLSHYESTENAYVAAPQIQLTAQVDGTISAVQMVETQPVKAGDVVLKIDPTEAKIASQMADAELLKAYRASRSAILQTKQRKADLDRVSADLKRRQSLQGVAAVSKEELDHLQTQYDVANNAYKEALERSDGLADVADSANHPDVQKAQAAAKQAYVALLRANVVSPVDAVVARRSAQVGQRVAPGVPLATLVMLSDTWVDANFKEDQLRHIRVGQAAKLEADIYGSKVVYAGKVVGFSPATGANLSLLPAQNATGNWVKVVQRLPVRIEINADQLKKSPLQVGLSMSVSVDTSKRDGEPLTAADQAKGTSTDIYEGQSNQADQHVQEILTKASKR